QGERRGTTARQGAAPRGRGYFLVVLPCLCRESSGRRKSRRRCIPADTLPPRCESLWERTGVNPKHLLTEGRRGREREKCSRLCHLLLLGWTLVVRFLFFRYMLNH